VSIDSEHDEDSSGFPAIVRNLEDELEDEELNENDPQTTSPPFCQGRTYRFGNLGAHGGKGCKESDDSRSELHNKFMKEG
jgi:hypothetical protein